MNTSLNVQTIGLPTVVRAVARTVVRTALSTVFAWLVFAAPFAQAQAVLPHPALGTTPVLQGKRLDGQAFDLSSLKGKVTLLFYWSTNCPVCRDKMPELRENYAGWRKQAFELVTVSVDARKKDLDDYEQILSVMVPTPQRFIQLWAGEPGYRDSLVDAAGKPVGKSSHLPSAYLIDKSGKVVETYTGRIPAEAWDRIAELL